MNEAGVAQLIRSRLAADFDIQRLVLFGSRAKGTATEASDWDVLVVAKTKMPFIERQGRAVAALGLRDFALDLLVCTPFEVEQAAKVTGSTVYWAEQEGREMNE